MSGLRFFEDMMHEAIALKRHHTAIRTRASEYIAKCEAARKQALQHRGDRMPPSFFEANEGAFAARMILGEQFVSRDKARREP